MSLKDSVTNFSCGFKHIIRRLLSGDLLFQITFALMVLSFCAVIFWLPRAEEFANTYGSGGLAKVMFVHVPLAIVSFVAFVAAAIYGIFYLRTREVRYDALECASAEVGLVYALLATVTGAIWARYTWGAFWNWDPRQVAMVVVLSTYAAYFALRSAIEGEEQRMVISSAYAIFAAVMALVNYFVLINWLPTLHPRHVIFSRSGMGFEYRVLLFISLLAYVGLCACLIKLNSRLRLLAEHIAGLQCKR
ncbi:MAG: cytochrome c biogenesis protein [Armatimonadota bacterium]|nr:cytochrome c biogenesis protein [Armatimonadota bacterium]MCX7777008.1 cytochrome c biogenesis protein [Armatimonadota bacterium]MDW8024924.1 cytochrome c biogenesis protein [Armatimonadota bacterium]